MEVVRPKKKRNELELLLGTGDGGPSAFSTKLPALSINSPTLPEATVESDEQLARRLHEELNGMRATRRGSRALAEDYSPMSPSARTVASPHSRTKPDTPNGGKAQSNVARGGSVALATAPGAAGGGAAAGGGPSVNASNTAAGGDGGSEGIKRRRNVVPARELHLLLQQASSGAGRAEASLRSARAGPAAIRADPSEPQPGPHDPGVADAAPEADASQPSRREPDADRARGLAADRPSPSSGSAPAVPLHPPGPLPPSQLPPKLRQRYLAGPPGQPNPGCASASACRDAKERGAARDGGGHASGAAAATTAEAPGATTVTPSGVLDGGRNSLLSGQSTDGSSQQSQSDVAWRERDGDTSARASAGAGAGPAGEAQQLTPAGSHVGGVGVAGGSGGGCSSTDETENDNENSCTAVVAGAGSDAPSATSPKGGPQPSAFNASQACEQGELEEASVQPHQAGSAHGQCHASALKVPKLPMIRAGRGWFRGRLVKEAPDGQRVLVEVPGAPGHQQPVWLPAASDRIWRGSYKGKDWKYLGDGAWEPKPGAFKRGKQGSSTNGLPLPLPLWALGAVTEVQPLPAEVPSPRPRRERDRSGAGTDLKHEQQRESRHAGSEGPSTRSQRAQHRTSVSGLDSGDEETGAAAPAVKSESAEEAERIAATSGPSDASDEEGLLTDAHAAAVDAAAGADDAGGAALCAAPEAAAVKLEEPAQAAHATADDVEMAAASADAVVGNAAAAHAEAAPSAAAERASGGSGSVATVAAAAAASQREAPVDKQGPNSSDSCDGTMWEPGAPFPRRHVPRRARRRRLQLRTPLDGLHLHARPHPHHHHYHAMLSGDESAGDAAASDAEQGGNGDGGAHHTGGRRRAAARAAAVAVAAARAEAEAEEDELEDGLLGRRPPRRDRSQAGCGAGIKRQSSLPPNQGCQRPRAVASRPDCYLYGDSSGALEDSFTGEAGVDARLRNGGRSHSQLGSEHGACGSAGGSPVWEATAAWQQSGQLGAGATAGSCQLLRNRRKGKPCRSRMDGEGGGWDPDWALESGAAIWARMPEAVRRLYYTPAPAPAAAAAKQQGQSGSGGEGQLVAGGRHGSFQQRRSAGFYPGAQAPPNKRRRVHDEDPGFLTPDDEPEPEEEADDPDRDEDYQPPAHTLGRRYSGAHGGRRCSGGGGPGGGAAGRRSMGVYETSGWSGGSAVVVVASRGGSSGGRGSIPSGLAGLLEAALGQSCEEAGAAELGGQRDVAAAGLTLMPEAVGGLMSPGVALFGGGAAAPQVAAQPHNTSQPHASHVALSDSSANHSAGEEGSGPATAGAAPRPPPALPPGPSSPLPAAGSPQPAGVLRPATPTRARRTGRPPSVALSPGAPLPKLPALSCSASLRLQQAAGPAASADAAAVSAAVNAAVAAAAVAANGCCASGAAATEQPDANALTCSGTAVVSHPGGICGAKEQAERPQPPTDAEPSGRASGTGEPQAPAPAGDGGAGNPHQWLGTVSSDGDASAGAGCSIFSAAAGASALAAAGAAASQPPAPLAAASAVVAACASGAAGSGCNVMDAIGALLHEQQPAMQQVAMQAQWELDTLGRAVQAQHAAMTAVLGAVHGSMQRQPSSGRRGGRGAGAAGALVPAMQCAQPPLPDALIAVLPSVDVVVDLFSSRSPCGSTQEALAEFVGGAAAMPLFH